MSYTPILAAVAVALLIYVPLLVRYGEVPALLRRRRR
jgi:hypothetical protein